MQNKKLDRAKQFMPFASLRGYYDIIRTCERIKEEKKDLSESEQEVISEKLNLVKKGDIISVKYYNIDAYDTINGMVSEIDKTYQTLTIIKTKIKFEDILSISI